jgi:Uma2 family endonuclease
MASVTPTRRSAPRTEAGPRSPGKLLPVSTQRPAVTMQDLLDQLGGIAPERVRLQPTPGTARQKDLLDARRGGSEPARLELVDGVLVEKLPMGWFESILASVLAGRIRAYLDQDNVGVVSSGGDGYLKLKPNMIRVPDVAVVLWERIPGRKSPRTPCPELVPDLVVEVLSKGNTKREIERKQRDFFAHGSRLFWVVDPRKQTVTVHRADGTRQVLGADDNVSGEQVLPGFQLSIREWFQVAEDGTRPGQKK